MFRFPSAADRDAGAKVCLSAVRFTYEKSLLSDFAAASFSGAKKCSPGAICMSPRGEILGCRDIRSHKQTRCTLLHNDALPSPQTEFLITVVGVERARHGVTAGDNIVGRNSGRALRVDAYLVSRQHAKLILNCDHALRSSRISARRTARRSTANQFRWTRAHAALAESKDPIRHGHHRTAALAIGCTERDVACRGAAGSSRRAAHGAAAGEFFLRWRISLAAAEFRHARG